MVYRAEQRGIISNGVKANAEALGLKNTFGLSKAELIRGVQRAEGNFHGSWVM
jgi:hypothetical protein